MRLIDNYLPEDEILKLYIGRHLPHFQKQVVMASSPTARGRVQITVYYHVFDKFKYSISYTRTRSAVRLALKEQFDDPNAAYAKPHYLTMEHWLYPIHDPEGPINLQKEICKHSAILRSSV